MSDAHTHRENTGSVEGQSKGQSWVSRGSYVDQMPLVRETTCACIHSVVNSLSVNEETACPCKRSPRVEICARPSGTRRTQLLDEAVVTLGAHASGVRELSFACGRRSHTKLNSWTSDRHIASTCKRIARVELCVRPKAARTIQLLDEAAVP